jgi:hypothetical protein
MQRSKEPSYSIIQDPSRPFCRHAQLRFRPKPTQRTKPVELRHLVELFWNAFDERAFDILLADRIGPRDARGGRPDKTVPGRLAEPAGRVRFVRLLIDL